MSSNDVYTTTKNLAQAVESFELKYAFMQMHYWKLNLFFKYVTPLLPFVLKEFF